MIPFKYVHCNGINELTAELEYSGWRKSLASMGGTALSQPVAKSVALLLGWAQNEEALHLRRSLLRLHQDNPSPDNSGGIVDSSLTCTPAGRSRRVPRRSRERPRAGPRRAIA